MRSPSGPSRSRMPQNIHPYPRPGRAPYRSWTPRPLLELDLAETADVRLIRALRTHALCSPTPHRPRLEPAANRLHRPHAPRHRAMACPMQPLGRLPYSMLPNLDPRNSPLCQRFVFRSPSRGLTHRDTGSAFVRELATSYRSETRRASTRSWMIWKSPTFSVRRGTPSTWAVAAMARSIWRRLGLPPRRATAAAS